MVTSRNCAGFTLLALAVVVGCQPPRHADVATREPHLHHHPVASADGPAVVPPGVVLASPADLVTGLRKPQHILALSSGGLYGAYSAGVLDGWTRTNTRPEFDVVTGTSTGALVAPFAFLGNEYDAPAVKLYTGVRGAEDVFRTRAWITIPFRDALATAAPLRKLIDSQINQEFLERVATEHRKGRRLYVGTTDLRTKRAVIWDMGAIACRPCAEGCPLFRDVLLASSSIPGVLPPVPFRVEVDGRAVTEYHIDGGVSAPLFMPPGVFASAGSAGDNPMMAGANFYAIIAGKMYPDEGPVRRRILPVLGASTEAILSAHCRAELATMYFQSRLAGVRFHTLALRQNADIHVDTAVSFNQEVMTKLYREGLADGQSGPNWMYAPPALSPCDGGYARGGLRLRTMPPATVAVP